MQNFWVDFSASIMIEAETWEEAEEKAIDKIYEANFSYGEIHTVEEVSGKE